MYVACRLIRGEQDRAIRWACVRYSQPGTCAGKHVLEIGSGGNPVVAFAALRHCRRLVATDGSPEALRLLERNICANARSASHWAMCVHSCRGFLPALLPGLHTNGLCVGTLLPDKYVCMVAVV